MSFWKYIGEFLLFRWLFDSRKRDTDVNHEPIIAGGSHNDHPYSKDMDREDNESYDRIITEQEDLMEEREDVDIDVVIDDDEDDFDDDKDLFDNDEFDDLEDYDDFLDDHDDFLDDHDDFDMIDDDF